MKTLHDRIYEEFEERRLMGIKKYGTTLEENPLSLRERLQHQKTELMDAILYLQRAIDEIDKF